MPAYREQLDGLICEGPDCGATGDSEHGPLYLHSKCHTQSPTWAAYQHGTLVITCAECKAPIAEIAVAREPGSNGANR